MKILKSHFSYNKRQRSGILFLLLLIIAFQITYFFIDFSPKKDSKDYSNEMISFLKEVDSLQEIKNEKSKPKIYPFNPNYITDFKGYQLGMSTAEIDKLLEYRKSGAFINSAAQFQKVTGVNDSLLYIISPYFKFPAWVTSAKNNEKEKEIVTKEAIVIKDINTASLEDFKSINGIGDKLGQRIISYRTKLQGFTFNDQLYEVWYLDKEVADKVLANFKVLEKPIIEKINVNKATFKEVLSIPYLDYELTKKIFQYRDEVAEIQTIEDLKKIDGFPLEKFNRIALYLQAK
ncbi:ComEA family DNA-binding protein [Lutibacter maritimus]|uniref:Helix-hairpin-helix motif-containing protein n=1 Tax=Lutibacter maritimus TaxID=593133 RepID=A0A1I6SB62_9FLAO|nr:helix-hairpin-helix domain-containing protein [Lutibacter maritimus]SFS74215.1 Helix-hairpin-helix motif-containing protein [Lutibacter maritimus]